MFSTHRNPSGDAPATPLQAEGDTRTFARRIDCAARADERPEPRSARGGGRRDPGAWEHARDAHR